MEMEINNARIEEVASPVFHGQELENDKVDNEEKNGL